MDITGHSTVAQFMQYIKITREESSMKLAKSAFFKKPTEKETCCKMKNIMFYRNIIIYIATIKC